MPGATLGLLLLVTIGGDLSTQARAGGRPHLCPLLAEASAAAGEGRPSVWDEIRDGASERLCFGLSRAQLLLASSPEAAFSRAAELAQLWPARPEPLVIEARAKLR